MIFITLGSQKFQFNRLLIAVDQLIEAGIITEEVFAQVGYSDYVPRKYKFKKFLDRQEFSNIMDRADIVITHGGTGAIIGALKKGKKVIAVARLSKYGEHVDDHQLQLIEQFKEQNLICGLSECNDIGNALNYIKNHAFNTYSSNTSRYIESIEKFLNEK